MNFLYPPKPIRAGLKTLEMLDNDPEWVAEPKIDGKRCIVICDEARSLLYSRHNRIMEIANFCLLEKSIFDSELKDGILYLFDCIRLKNNLITLRTLEERRTILEGLRIQNDFIRIVPQTIENKKIFYYKCLDAGYEGIVLKRLKSAYMFGLVSSPIIRDWIKIKR